MKEEKGTKRPQRDITDSFLYSSCMRFCRCCWNNFCTKKQFIIVAIIIIVFALTIWKVTDCDIPDYDQIDSTSITFEQKILEYNRAAKDYNAVADDYNAIRGLASLEDVENLPDVCGLKAYLDEGSENNITEDGISQNILHVLKDTSELKNALNRAYTAFNQKILNYNEAVRNYNIVLEEYSKIREITSLENIADLPETKEPKECLEENAEISDFIQNGISQDAVLQDIEIITQETKDLLYVLILAQQITNPDKNWVIDRLTVVDNIMQAQAVTETNDPNQLLNVDGGYTSCVYFSVQGINQNSIRGTGIIDKGTDAGGAIEVYKTVMDAQNRCDYLGQFDNTLLYSGSYAILGTMVIRTSYLLTNEQQVELTNKITTAFTALK